MSILLDKFFLMLKKILKGFVKFLWFLLIIFTVWILFISIFKKEWIEIFIEWMKNVISILWYCNYLIAFLSSLIESFPVLWGFLPWTNILLLVGWFFWNISINNVVFMIIVASIWAIFGNLIWYILWVYYWKHFFEKYWDYVWIWKTEVKYLEKWIKKWWMWWIIIWKFHATTRTFMPFIAWSSWMNSSKFMIYNTIWSIIRASLTVIIWVFFVNYYKIILDYAWTIMFAILVLVWLYIYYFKKKEFLVYWEEKNREIEEKAKK